MQEVRGPDRRGWDTSVRASGARAASRSSGARSFAAARARGAPEVVQARLESTATQALDEPAAARAFVEPAAARALVEPARTRPGFTPASAPSRQWQAERASQSRAWRAPQFDAGANDGCANRLEPSVRCDTARCADAERAGACAAGRLGEYLDVERFAARGRSLST
jgi:hypothetical protein